ncbi:MAG: dihydroneopterin triphosphate diphosphatase [Blastocatellia bacterium]|nr:dihydroneopterin triphosphate diphosphatase [Blastocatellia bacterium]
MSYKQPRSVQVVIFTETHARREYLLLRRVAGHGGFWQSVTGSVEEGETHAQTAVREVREETGILCREDELIDLGLTNTFEIAEKWLPKYAPGVTHNEEVCFALRVEKREARIDPSEHDASIWVDYRSALEMLFWESNKRAFAALARLLG